MFSAVDHSMVPLPALAVRVKKVPGNEREPLLPPQLSRAGASVPLDVENREAR
jgi:hypothetical protein